jgi:molybdopterin molybdotransferase
VISVEEALALCLALVPALPVEEVALRHAAGRWLAGPVTARRDQPPFDASAMDGYAIQGDPAPGHRFSVIGESGAGHAFAGNIGPGQALRTFTGAPIPAGATRVLIQEDVERTGDVITVKPGADLPTHIRPRGQDFATGFQMTPRRLRPADIGLLAAMNLAAVPLRRRPTVAILATGDELVQPGEVPRPDQIPSSNGVMLSAIAAAEGAEVRLLPIARDRMAELQGLLTLAASADLVVTIGGASVGDHDLVAKAAEGLGLQRSFWKIAMRPGKPLMAGRMGGSVLLGLPGNPVAAFVCAQLFLRPMMRALQGDPAPGPRPRQAILATDVTETGPRTHYMRARLTPGAGLPQITPFPRQDSALLSVLAEADALLIRPLGDGPRKAGAEVSYLPL